MDVYWPTGAGLTEMSHPCRVTNILPEVVPGPNQTLDPHFSDGEIFLWVIKKHVTCWYHQWTPGGSTEPHWLRYLLYETLTAVVPGPNQTLDPDFSDAEIFLCVITEHVTCWYHHWTPGGSTEPHWL